MTKEELIEYKKKLSQLSEKEQKLRDLHLRQLANGEIQGPPTGYASIDKLSLKYFSSNIIDYKTPKVSIYDYFKNKALKFKNLVAINYFGKKITYSQILNNIENYAKALEHEIQKGDKVILLEACTPESIYLIYALNILGAISVPIDPRMTSEQVESCISEINPKLIISINNCISIFEHIDNEKIEGKIVRHDVLNSAPIYIKLLANIKNNFKSDIPMLYKSNNKNQNYNFNQKVNGEDTAIIIYTGGTTGTKKGVQLSNININSMVEQHILSGIPNYIGESILQFMPPFIAYGIVDGIHMSLCLGWKLLMLPSFEFEDFPETLEKLKPNVVLASPVHFDYLLKNNKKLNLSSLEYIISGGDSMNKEIEKKINFKLKQNKCNIPVGQGLGMTEASGTISVPVPGNIKCGSVGLAFPNTLVGIFNPNTDEELSYDSLGEICISGDNIMKGYYNKIDETNNILKEHSDGTKWLHTGDIGYIDKDGYLFHIDRIKRIINRNGMKIFPSQLEQLIEENDNVIGCVVIGLYNEKERNVPIAHIVFKDNNKINETIYEIFEECKKHLYSEYLPYGIKSRDDFPYTKNGKIDYKRLEEEKYDKIVYTSDLEENKKYIKNKLGVF